MQSPIVLAYYVTSNLLLPFFSKRWFILIWLELTIICCIFLIQKTFLKTWNKLILHGVSEHLEYTAFSRLLFQCSFSTAGAAAASQGLLELLGIAHGTAGELCLHVPAVLCKGYCKASSTKEMRKCPLADRKHKQQMSVRRWSSCPIFLTFN